MSQILQIYNFWGEGNPCILESWNFLQLRIQFGTLILFILQHDYNKEL